MLPTEATCDIPEGACCTDLFTVAEHILSSVHGQLLDCFGADCAELPAYVTMGEGDDGVRDALTVAFTTVAPSGGSARQNVQLPITLQRATFIMRLKESGWPMVQIVNAEIVPPQPDRQNALARHAFAHAEKMYRTLLWLKATRTLVPSGVGCTQTSIGPLTPLRPTSGVVGFTSTITLDLPWGGG